MEDKQREVVMLSVCVGRIQKVSGELEVVMNRRVGVS